MQEYSSFNKLGQSNRMSVLYASRENEYISIHVGEDK